MSVDLHPVDLLERAGMGALSVHERIVLENHARDCSECRLELTVRSDARAECGSGDDATSVDSMVERAARRLEAGEVHRPSWPRTLVGFVAGAAVGGLVLGLAVRFGGAPDAGRRTGSERVMPQAVDAPLDGGGASGVVRDRPRARTRVEPTPEPTAAQTRTQTREPSKPDGPSSSDPTGAPGSRTRRDGATEPAPTAASLFSAATRAQRTGAPRRAIRLFDQTIESFPESREAKTALVLSARIRLQELDDVVGALQRYTRYLEGAPAGTLRPEAMAGRARSLERLGRADEAEAAWEALVREYPNSAPARRAKERR